MSNGIKGDKGEIKLFIFGTVKILFHLLVFNNLIIINFLQ